MTTIKSKLPPSEQLEADNNACFVYESSDLAGRVEEWRVKNKLENKDVLDWILNRIESASRDGRSYTFAEIIDVPFFGVRIMPSTRIHKNTQGPWIVMFF